MLLCYSLCNVTKFDTLQHYYVRNVVTSLFFHEIATLGNVHRIRRLVCVLYVKIMNLWKSLYIYITKCEKIYIR
jgi:hypothetical protein